RRRALRDCSRRSRRVARSHTRTLRAARLPDAGLAGALASHGTRRRNRVCAGAGRAIPGRAMKRIALLLMVGCAPGAFDRQNEPIPGRDDVALDTLHVKTHGGLSDEFVLTLPDGADGALIEVRGGG